MTSHRQQGVESNYKWKKHFLCLNFNVHTYKHKQLVAIFVCKISWLILRSLNWIPMSSSSLHSSWWCPPTAVIDICLSAPARKKVYQIFLWGAAVRSPGWPPGAGGGRAQVWPALCWEPEPDRSSPGQRSGRQLPYAMKAQLKAFVLSFAGSLKHKRADNLRAEVGPAASNMTT